VPRVSAVILHAQIALYLKLAYKRDRLGRLGPQAYPIGASNQT
jgi:hypothetical protein